MLGRLVAVVMMVFVGNMVAVRSGLSDVAPDALSGMLNDMQQSQGPGEAGGPFGGDPAPGMLGQDDDRARVVDWQMQQQGAPADQYAHDSASAEPMGQQPMRFREMKDDPVELETGYPDTDTSELPDGSKSLTADDVNKLRDSGMDEQKIVQEMATRKRTQELLNGASVAMDKAQAAQDTYQAAAEDAAEKAQNQQEQAQDSDELSAQEKAELQEKFDQARERVKAAHVQRKQNEAMKAQVVQAVEAEAREQAAKDAANYADMTPEQILAADQMDRQQQFLTSLTPEAVASAEVELSSVFSSVIGSLLTNMLSREPELVAKHMGVPLRPQQAGNRR